MLAWIHYKLAVDTDVTSQHIFCTSICPSLLRGCLPRQLRVKVRDHIVHNSTALHLHSRLEWQETCNSWKTRKTRTPLSYLSRVSAGKWMEWRPKIVRRTVRRDIVTETRNVARAWNLHQGRILGDIKLEVLPPAENRPPVAFFYTLHQGCKHGRIQFHHLKLWRLGLGQDAHPVEFLPTG